MWSYLEYILDSSFPANPAVKPMLVEGDVEWGYCPFALSVIVAVTVVVVAVAVVDVVAIVLVIVLALVLVVEMGLAVAVAVGAASEIVVVVVELKIVANQILPVIFLNQIHFVER